MNLKSIFYFAAILMATSNVAYADVSLKCTDNSKPDVAISRVYAEALSQGISPRFIKTIANSENNQISFKLDIPESNTLRINSAPYFKIMPDQITLPTSAGTYKKVETVSKKEIFLAYLYGGRVSSFEGQDCGVNAFLETIEIRQLIVAWAQKLEWGWPEGGPAKWNTKYWLKGTPVNKNKTVAAFRDALINQNKYEIGCYTATKLVFANAYLDYYARVKPNSHKLNKVIEALWQDQDPLVALEPEEFWKFEPDFEKKSSYADGKLLKQEPNVSAYNFIPGDWAYFLNTDSVSYQKTGYEGSNSIYLGNNRFDDYYNDNQGFYSFEEKLDELVQWKNGVFSRSRHVNKIKPLSMEDLYKYATTPENGGFLVSTRLVPKQF